jgi:predicted permease
LSVKVDRYRELRRLLRGNRVGEEIDEELAHHLAMRYSDNIAAGMSGEAAWEDARRRFGDLARVKHETEAIDLEAIKEERRMELMDSIVREMRLAIRTIFRAPGFAVLSILTLALGIGASSAIFTLLNSIVLQPLPYAHADRLVQLSHPVPKVGEGQRWGSSEAGYFDYLDRNHSFEKMGGYRQTTLVLTDGRSSERVDAIGLTASMFDLLGARPAVGRLFDAADDKPHGPASVVISNDEWRTRFGGRRDIVGSTLKLDGIPYTVVGVLAPRFEFPASRAAYYVDLQMDRTKEAANYHWVGVYARLRAGVTPEAASADLRSIMSGFPQRMPGAYSEDFFRGTGFHPSVTTLRSEILGTIDRTLWILLSAVLLVLLIACANVANLFLVRGEARRREIAVRSALGAQSPHLAVHFLAESFVVTAFAGLLALFIAYSGVHALVAMAPVGVPRLNEIRVGWPVVAFTAGISIAAAMVFGSFPLLRRNATYASLREGGRGLSSSRGQYAARNGLVAAQMALALILLISGALLLQSYRNLRSVDIGINPENLLTAQISLPNSRYDKHEAVRAFFEALSQRVHALPGVTAVGFTSTLPLGGGGWCSVTQTEGLDGRPSDSKCVPINQVAPGYFEAMGIRVRGNTFSWSDLDRRAGVAVISRALADRYFPGQDPIGRHIMSYRSGPPWYEIIGVAENVHADGADRPATQPVYYPITPMDIPGQWDVQNNLVIAIRTASARPERLTPALRRILSELDEDVPLADVRTMEDVVASSPAVARSSFTLLLLAVAAALALFLSAVGLYGVISYIVTQRRTEIGIRMALGARSDQVRRLIVGQSLGVVAAGAFIGLPIAFVGTRVLRSLLFGVSPTDAGTFAGVTILLLVVGAFASWMPALRAARVQPMNVLRED